MSYVHITHTPGLGLDEYGRVVAHLGASPVDGQLTHVVGVSDGALHIVDTWVSRDHADRFAAQRLFPAFAASGVRPSAEQTVVAFESSEEGPIGG